MHTYSNTISESAIISMSSLGEENRIGTLCDPYALLTHILIQYTSKTNVRKTIMLVF